MMLARSPPARFRSGGVAHVWQPSDVCKLTKAAFLGARFTSIRAGPSMEKLRHRPIGVPCDGSGAGLPFRTSLMEERIVEPGSSMPGAEVDRTLDIRSIPSRTLVRVLAAF